MDLYRLGKVKYADFKRIIADNEDPCDNPIVTGDRPNDKFSFDWKLKARQQIGYWIARNLNSIDECFDIVSKNTDRIDYVTFKEWIEAKQVLRGFNLTDKLVQQLFSDLDPHKKGHLTDVDWKTAFGGYSSDD